MTFYQMVFIEVSKFANEKRIIKKQLTENIMLDFE